MLDIPQKNTLLLRFLNSRKVTVTPSLKKHHYFYCFNPDLKIWLLFFQYKYHLNILFFTKVYISDILIMQYN